MKITVKEFKMWLQGVEEMQDEAWTPDTRQWNKIREKINQIDEVDHSSDFMSSSSPRLLSAPVQQLDQPVPRYEGPVQMAAAGLANVAPIQPTYQPAQMSNMLFGNADAPAIPSKTPNIDTSTAPYEPMFL